MAAFQLLLLWCPNALFPSFLLYLLIGIVYKECLSFLPLIYLFSMSQGYPFYPLCYNQYNYWIYVIFLLFTMFQLGPLAALSGDRQASVLSYLSELPYFLAPQGVSCSSNHFPKEFWFVLLENYTCLSENYESLNAAPISKLPHWCSLFCFPQRKINLK